MSICIANTKSQATMEALAITENVGRLLKVMLWTYLLLVSFDVST